MVWLGSLLRVSWDWNLGVSQNGYLTVEYKENLQLDVDRITYLAATWLWSLFCWLSVGSHSHQSSNGPSNPSCGLNLWLLTPVWKTFCLEGFMWLLSARPTWINFHSLKSIEFELELYLQSVFTAVPRFVLDWITTNWNRKPSSNSGWAS